MGTESVGLDLAGLGFDIYHKSSVADPNTFQIFYTLFIWDLLLPLQQHENKAELPIQSPINLDHGPESPSALKD